MRVGALLRFIAGERSNLAFDRLGDVEEVIRLEEPDECGCPLGARSGRIREHAPGRLPWNGPRGDSYRRECGLMVPVHVGMNAVDRGGCEVPHLRLYDRVQIRVRERVEPHVRQVEVDVVVDAELLRGPDRLVGLLGTLRIVARVLGRASVRQAEDANAVPAYDRVHSDRRAHAEHFVVRVRGHDEDTLAHPSFTPSGIALAMSAAETGSPPSACISSSRSPPSPQATTTPDSRSSTTVPAAPGAESGID